MEEQTLLEELGFNRHESKIYLLLLKLGESTAVRLGKESGLHRRTVYDTLDKLQKKGFVNTKIKKHIKHFIPTSPERLKEISEEKNILIEKILPSLLKQFISGEHKPVVSIFEGVEGMKAALNDLLRECKKTKGEVTMLGAGLRTPQYMRYSFPHYINHLKKIKWRLIEPNIERVREDLDKWEISKELMKKHCRFLPAKYLSPLGILVYTDRTIIMLLESEPVLLKIIGINYAKAFRNYFELLWNAAK